MRFPGGSSPNERLGVRARVAIALGQRPGWKLMHPGAHRDWQLCGYCRLGIPLYSVRFVWCRAEGEDLSAFLERYRRRCTDDPKDLALPLNQWVANYCRQNFALPDDQWTLRYYRHFPRGDEEAIRAGLEEFASYHQDYLGHGPADLEIDRWVARIEDDESTEIYTL